MNVRESCLIEIYTKHTESFSVGQLFCQNDGAAVFYDIDAQGKISGYCAMRKSYISSLEYNTEYLMKIAKYMDYAEKHTYFAWFHINAVTFRTDMDLFCQILEYSHKKDILVTIGLMNEEELTVGRIQRLGRDELVLSCIDISNAQFMESRNVFVRDIVYIGFETIDNLLLSYAEQN